MNRFRLLFLLVLVLLISFCATYLPEYKSAESYYISGNFEKAYELYKAALEKDPLNRRYRTGYFKAKTALILSYSKALKFYIENNQRDRAINYLKKLISLDPENYRYKDMLQKLEKSRDVKRKFKTSKKNIAGKAEKEKLVNIKFKNAPISEILKAIAKVGNFNIVFDSNFKDKEYSVELKNKSWEDALNIICTATKTFYVKLDENTILVAPDNLMSRNQYKREEARVFYLFEANGKNLMQVLSRIIRGKVSLSYLEDINAIVARGASKDLDFLAQLTKKLDKPKEQVMIEINIMEVSNNFIKNLGSNLLSAGVGISLNSNGEAATLNLDEISKISKTNVYLTIPSSYITLLETSGYTKTLATPTIVGMEGEKLTFKIGEKFPLPNTQFQAMAAGGVSSVPVTSYEFKDVGLNFEVTPYIHRGGEVSLKMKIQVSAIGTSGYGDIPSIRNREIEVNLRLKEGETNILAGLLQEEEKRTLTGILGLSKIPLIGKLFGNTTNTHSQTDLIFTITPYIIKRLEITKSDESPILLRKNERIEVEPQIMTDRYLGKRPFQKTSNNDRLFLPKKLYMRAGRAYTLIVSGKVKEKILRGNLSFSYDPQYMEVSNLVKSSKKTFSNFDNSSGRIDLGVSFDKGKSGIISFATITFKPKKAGDTSIDIISVDLRDSSGKSIDLEYPDKIEISIK